MIRSSSLGLSSHRTAAMELIIERSIQERRERMFAKAKNRLWSDLTPQAKRGSEAPNISVPEVQLPAPAPAPQPPSQSFPDDTTGTVTSPEPAPSKYKTSGDSWISSKPAKKFKRGVQYEESPADVKTNPSPSEDFAELECRVCHLKQLRSYLLGGVYCRSFSCPGGWMGCVGCGTVRADDVDACTSCHRKFK